MRLKNRLVAASVLVVVCLALGVSACSDVAETVSGTEDQFEPDYGAAWAGKYNGAETVYFVPTGTTYTNVGVEVEIIRSSHNTVSIDSWAGREGIPTFWGEFEVHSASSMSDSWQSSGSRFEVTLTLSGNRVTGMIRQAFQRTDGGYDQYARWDINVSR